MSSPWLTVPLEDYEGHMGSPGVAQLTVLADLFQRALEAGRPKSVAVLGVAGGNGLEHIDSTITSRIVGVDINRAYLEEVRRRHEALRGLELHCLDLASQDLETEPVDLVHAALFFEHAGLDLALKNALSVAGPEGILSVVLQLPSQEEAPVACSRYTSMHALKGGFSLIAPEKLERLLERRGFQLILQEQRALPAGKALWLGVFGRRR